MKIFGRYMLVFLVLVGASIAWMTLGATLSVRTSNARSALTDDVAELWGSPHTQPRPKGVVVWTEEREEVEVIYDLETKSNVEKTRFVEEEFRESLEPASSILAVRLGKDERRRGLMWFPLYDVHFAGAYQFANTTDKTGQLEMSLAFPTGQGIYDDFRFVVDGTDRAVLGENGGAGWTVPIEPGQVVELEVGYRSRGLGTWKYEPTHGVSTIQDFALTMYTDFEAIDFPAGTMSPSSRERSGEGWKLQWNFDRVVTGHAIGMQLPERTQPGELAERLTYSSPVSLGLFFVVITALAIRHERNLHPVHYTFLAAAFFAFPLLLAYLVDHLLLTWAFGISGAVSMLLVVSYLRLVVSDGFAFGPAAAAQGIYQVGFGLAHFWTGFTGLSVTILGILTLFFMMQVTGRTDWEEVFASEKPSPA